MIAYLTKVISFIEIVKKKMEKTKKDWEERNLMREENSRKQVGHDMDVVQPLCSLFSSLQMNHETEGVWGKRCLNSYIE
jgi:hypothetical protein